MLAVFSAGDYFFIRYIMSWVSQQLDTSLILCLGSLLFENSYALAAIAALLMAQTDGMTDLSLSIFESSSDPPLV